MNGRNDFELKLNFADWVAGGAEAPLYRSLRYEWGALFRSDQIEIVGNGFAELGGRSFVAFYRRVHAAARRKPCPSRVRKRPLTPAFRSCKSMDTGRAAPIHSPSSLAHKLLHCKHHQENKSCEVQQVSDLEPSG